VLNPPWCKNYTTKSQLQQKLQVKSTKGIFDFAKLKPVLVKFQWFYAFYYVKLTVARQCV